MIIRLGLLDSDERYLKLLSGYFNEHPDENFQIESYLFFDTDSYESFKQSGTRIDILLASPDELKNSDAVPDRTVLAYLTEDKTIQSWDGYPVICKFQKASDILRSIQGLAAKLSAGAGNFSLGKAGGIISFIGAAGGVGTTTAAMGCAVRMANIGKSVLYFNMQQTARPEAVFQSGASISEVYYAYREWKSMSGNANEGSLQLRLKSLVSKDQEFGVDSFAGFTLPLDALEIQAAEIAELAKVLSGLYDIVVVDLESRIDEVLMEFLKIANWTVLVSDGIEDSNYCLERLSKSIDELNKADGILKGEVGVLYSKFGSASRHTGLDNYVRNVGDIPKVGNATKKEIVRTLRNSTAFALLEK
ncbi:MAG: AAA family ATPase [Lachnospiraceae bacterium]|nr:AAA family ATPase [Lachnospiraceae bacterium]